jgi:hypothetical protein
MSSALPPEVTLEFMLGVLRSHNPELEAMILAADEEQFLKAAEQGLERGIRAIESGAKTYLGLDELGLSKLLADLLRQAGFGATAETYHNGHVDITISHFDPGRYVYLGECKLYDGYAHHRDGCKQVLGYSSGRDSRVFCLDFFKTHDMYPKLDSLRRAFDRYKPLRLKGKAVSHTFKGAFTTGHAHPAGSVVDILHIGCWVHVAVIPGPRSRRGRRRKKL